MKYFPNVTLSLLKLVKIKKVHIPEKYKSPAKFGELRDKFSIERLALPVGYPGSSPFASFMEFEGTFLVIVSI